MIIFKQTKDRRKWFDFVCMILLSIALLLYLYMFVVCVIALPFQHNYLHTDIYDTILFWATVLLSLILPLSLCIGCYFSLKIKNNGLKVGVSIICITLLALWFLPNVVLLGGDGGIASYTTQLDDFGVFDQTVKVTIDNYLPENFFPCEEILDNESQYCYYYTFGSFREDYDIQLEAHIVGQEEYTAEKARLMNMQMTEFSREKFYVCNTIGQVVSESILGEDFGERVYAVVCFDDLNRKITYRVFSAEYHTSGLKQIESTD